MSQMSKQAGLMIHFWFQVCTAIDSPNEGYKFNEPTRRRKSDRQAKIGGLDQEYSA